VQLDKGIAAITDAAKKEDGAGPPPSVSPPLSSPPLPLLPLETLGVAPPPRLSPVVALCLDRSPESHRQDLALTVLCAIFARRRKPKLSTPNAGVTAAAGDVKKAGQEFLSQANAPVIFN